MKVRFFVCIMFLINIAVINSITAQVTYISESFETFPFPPNGWDGDIGASPKWERTNMSPNTGSFSAMVGLGVWEEVEASFITPEIDLSQSPAKYLNFFYRYAYEPGGNNDSTFIEISYDSENWTILHILKAEEQYNDTWTEQFIDLSEYANEIFQIRWRYVGEGMAAWQLQIDDVNIGAALPDGLNADFQLNNSSVNVFWTHPGADLFKVYRSLDDQNYEFIGEVNQNEFLDQNLDYNTNYYYKITAVYGSLETDKSQALNVYIPGGNEIYLDDFESGIIDESYTLIDVDNSPAWVSMDYSSLQSTFEPFAWRIRSSNDDTHFFCHSGEFSIGTGYNNDGTANNDWIILPQINVEDDTYRFGFYAISQDPANKEALKVMISTQSNNIDDFQEVLYETNVSGRPNWQHLEIDLSEYQSQQIYIAIRCVSNNKYVLIVDDIYVFNDNIISEYAKSSIDDFKLEVYPNPARNKIFINNCLDTKNIDIEIYNVVGERVFLNNIARNNELSYLDIYHLKNGIYIIKVKQNNKVFQTKFVKF